ncbi:MAG: hypothetical protein QNJ19_09765 [Woeseiaceae bacterium]|nr:hypothetical protein [Woeseiaceae bacterium]
MTLKKIHKLLLINIFFLSFAVFAQEASDSAQAEAPQPPCLAVDDFNAFDFWLGDWEVHTADGTLAGQNTISKVHNGCLITESWRGAQGSIGTSINYLDRVEGEWVQIWNDAGGSQINIRGGLTDDGMLLVGKIHYISNGTTADFRGLWTPLPDGRVRQFFEQSVDGGETWTTWFEGFYTKKPAG